MRKKRLGIVGLVQNFCTLAGFGPYFVEASPGEWVPARDDDNAMVKLHKEFFAFMLSCMANGGLARRPNGELVLVGACCGAGFARAWVCLGGCAMRSGLACEVRVLTPAARRAREAPKGGTFEYRSRPGTNLLVYGKTAGEVLKEHQYGVGGYAKEPYAYSTLVQYIDSLRWFYEQYKETKGKGEGQNPAYAKVVADMKKALSYIMGTARRYMEPWVVKRVLGTLRADKAEDALHAMYFSHGMTLGERTGTKFVRDHGNIEEAADGLLIFRKIGKGDREQARAVWSRYATC